MTSGIVLGADGKPTSWKLESFCPSCRERATKRITQSFFGGFWRRFCPCGYVYDEGRGVPPVEE